ncbi:hypothetical protein HDU96_004693 [Phlyctochytrium bullatum]|nr:hypothetical protein HDU96_004693 [Phlyctochytrium bullatum]
METAPPPSSQPSSAPASSLPTPSPPPSGSPTSEHIPAAPSESKTAAAIQSPSSNSAPVDPKKDREATPQLPPTAGLTSAPPNGPLPPHPGPLPLVTTSTTPTPANVPAPLPTPPITVDREPRTSLTHPIGVSWLFPDDFLIVTPERAKAAAAAASQQQAGTAKPSVSPTKASPTAPATSDTAAAGSNSTKAPVSSAAASPAPSTTAPSGQLATTTPTSNPAPSLIPVPVSKPPPSSNAGQPSSNSLAPSSSKPSAKEPLDWLDRLGVEKLPMGRAPSASGFVGGFKVAASYIDRSIQLQAAGGKPPPPPKSIYRAAGLPSSAHGNFALSSCPGKKVRLDTGPVNGRDHHSHLLTMDLPTSYFLRDTAMINRDLNLDFARLASLQIKLVVWYVRSSPGGFVIAVFYATGLI